MPAKLRGGWQSGDIFSLDSERNGDIGERLTLEGATGFCFPNGFDAVASGAGQLLLCPATCFAQQPNSSSIGFVAEHDWSGL